MRLSKAEGGEQYCDLNKCVGFTLGEYCKHWGYREYCDQNKCVEFTLGEYCEYCAYCEYCDLNKCVGFTLGEGERGQLTNWQTLLSILGRFPFTLSRVKLGLFYIIQLKILFSLLRTKQIWQIWSSVSKSDYVKCPLAQLRLRPLLCSANSSGPFTSHACIQITLRAFHFVFLL